jgi:hypothetical protein
VDIDTSLTFLCPYLLLSAYLAPRVPKMKYQQQMNLSFLSKNHILGIYDSLLVWKWAV